MPIANRFTAATLFLAALVLAHATYASANMVDPEEACQKGRHAAAAKYAACEQRATSGVVSNGEWASYFPAVAKCHVKYAATWAKLQAKANGSGTICDNPRFVDNADGTVLDRLTGLLWEQKTDDASIHDKDDLHTWSAGGVTATAADGPVYTTFLGTLNTGCFAGQCDWRLPTRTELLTILLNGYYCPSNPCIDPVFGPTIGAGYWTGTTSASFSHFAWVVDFVSGAVDYNGGGKNVGFFVRAVRGGL
jgi:hypothetical protein